jgi:hypothetical protein
VVVSPGNGAVLLASEPGSLCCWPGFTYCSQLTSNLQGTQATRLSASGTVPAMVVCAALRVEGIAVSECKTGITQQEWFVGMLCCSAHTALQCQKPKCPGRRVSQ